MLFFTPVHQGSEGIRTSTASKYTALFSLLLRASDMAVVVVAGVLAYWLLQLDTSEVPLHVERNIISGVVFGLIVFGNSSLYRSWRGSALSAECFKAAWLWTLAFGIAVVVMAAVELTGNIPRLWWAAWYVATLAGFVGVRILCRGAAAMTRQHGLDLRHAVVIGATADARRIIGTFEKERWAGIKVHGWFSTPADTAHIDEAPHLGDLDGLAGYVEARDIHQVWIALPLGAQEQIDAILAALKHSTAEIKLVPDLFGLQVLNHSVGQIAGLPVINLRASPLDGHARLLKAIEDRVLAAVILLLIAPLMAAIALGVKLSSPGPVLFRQPRHGRDGKVIEVWKFRSMRVHQEADGQVTQARKHDSRVTPFGRFLRQSSLDELPQFFNVLLGTMSIVGPRPHAVAHNHQYKDVVQDYMQRHRLKPGITGWAQVNGLRGETDTVCKMAARVEHDLYYMQNWSLVLDLKIIVMTMVMGFIGKNAY